MSPRSNIRRLFPALPRDYIRRRRAVRRFTNSPLKICCYLQTTFPHFFKGSPFVLLTLLPAPSDTEYSMARYSTYLGRRVEVQYRAGDILLPASGTFVADCRRFGRTLFGCASFPSAPQDRLILPQTSPSLLLPPNSATIVSSF